MADFEKIKDYFADSDPDIRSQIIGLETKIKTAKLYNNLKGHDAVKMILTQCDAALHYYNLWLQEQVVNTEADKIQRARFMAYRDSFAWIRKLFTVENKLAKDEEAAAALEAQAAAGE